MVCSFEEAEFDRLVGELVADQAPRTFALVAERGERVDAKVVGWGMEFDDEVEVISAVGDYRLRFQSLDGVLRLLAKRGKIRVVYFPETAVSPAGEFSRRT